jgi:diguanylate cyclase (GGDEF)-like protein
LKAKAQKEISTEKARREQGRVLLVTDASTVSCRAPLEYGGLQVVGVPAGVAALISLRRHRPHLVIASSAIKGLSINDLARTLTQTEDNLPLLVVGPEPSTPKLRHAVIAAGAFDYFQLPEEVDLLVLRSNQLVRIRQLIDQLRAEADLDHLTGLANRRRFRVALTRELERWRRYHTPCTLLMLDIDHMKDINDEHGHPFGDLVIRHIANKLSAVSRDTDTAARLGGEEFALLLAGVDETKAESAARRLLEILSEESIDGVRNVTVSIGLASCPTHADSERALYAAGDAALYVAKNEGRNRVSVAPPRQQSLPGV